MFDFGSPEKRRKPFTLKQKRIEWLKAARRDPEGKFYKTSRCRKCKIRLVWGDRGYDFDHKDNNPSNNRQSNCFLVCKNCHGKATKMEVRIYEHTLTGERIYKTVKKKVSYKKPKAKPKKKTKARRRERSPFWPWF
jgi:5-methylcytosine-specific restriction endonuclease McrA